MTILWCGGEDIDFIPPSIMDVNTGTNVRRTAYTRCCMYIAYNSDGLYSPKFTPITSAWLTFRNSRWTWSITDRVGFGFRNSSNGACLMIGSGATSNGKVAVLTYDGTSAVKLAEESGTSLSLTGNPYKIDVQLTNYGVSGNIKVYVDLVKIIDYTGDLTVLSNTYFDQIRGIAVYGAMEYHISEVIVADEDTRLMSLKTLYPDAAGDSNDWTGAYTDVDETARDVDDVIYTATRGDDFQCNLTGMPAGEQKVKSVKVVVNSVDPSQVLGLKLGIKTNSVIHLNDARTQDSSWASFEKFFHNNPETSDLFTSSEIDALQLALRCDSTTTTTSTTSTTTTTTPP